MAQQSWFGKLAANLFGKKKDEEPPARKLSDRGMLVFQHTSEVIAAEKALRDAGFNVEVKGPPPDLQTGCDMVIVFPLIRQAAVKNLLDQHNLKPEKIISAADVLLDPVSLYHVTDFGRWVMARAANMKITMDKETGKIVNVSGGGCPDVPWLATQMCGKTLCEAPEPVSMGHTLCCYSLQKAYKELKRRSPCG